MEPTWHGFCSRAPTMLLVSLRARRVLAVAASGPLLLGFGLLASTGCGATGGAPRRAGGGGAAGAGGVTIGLGGSAANASGASNGADKGAQVECFGSGDCPLQRPHCVVAQGRCVECLSNTNCSGAIGGKFCGPLLTCVACVSDANCPATQPYCSDEGRCVECLTARNCDNARATCNAVTKHCVGACDVSDDCTATTGFPFCKEDKHECVQCLQDDQCPELAPHCLIDAGECAACLGDEDCAAGAPRCDTAGNHTCAECLGNEDCSGGYICQTHKCVVVPG